ncbi:MAG: hypothetical protein ACI9TV_002355 [Sulfurimonas sp.]|jgi:hypothetical protein|uniref:flagellar assembly protein A n=1 Tax=Sulfurimonas sp. TaxID=2022749 RepID=UPI0039E6AA89
MINPITVVTNNVGKELVRIAAQNSLSASQLYIEINSVKTFVKSADSEFIEIFANDLSKYKDEAYLRDSTIEFEQEYNIEVNSMYDDDPFKDMLCDIEFEENDTLAYLVIRKGSKLKYYDELYTDFLNYIIEQKLRSNIMLYLFDADYKGSVKGFVDVIEKINKILFKEDKKILISKGLNTIESIHSDISMLIEENNDVGAEDSEGKVDYSNRGFLLSCAEGEQLFEFIKPQQGKHGRNCKGKFLEVETINLDSNPTFTVEGGIEVQDSFEHIKYFSNKSGYVVKKGNQYEVSNSIDVDEISFKTTGTINSDLESEISINVIKNDPLEDAIEEGMHVKVQRLSVKGSIGPSTKIEAREIYIDGQTHNESYIKCVNAKIGQHRGKIIGRRVEVKTLEGGEIIADVAIVKNAVRGSIQAKIIEIEILGSHVTMEASEYIQIDIVKGEENRFIIDTTIKGAFDNNNKEENTAYLEKLQEELKPLLRILKETTAKVKKNLEPCEKIKAAIIKNKNLGVQIPATLVKNFKLCQIMKVHYKKLKEDFEYKKDQIEILKKKIFSSAVDILDTKIIVNQPIRGYNSIKYRLSNPPREINLKINESMHKKTFKLMEDEEGILKIVNID